MDPDKDNANPTVLDASQLPTRRRQKVVDEAEDGEAEAARHARREKSAIPGGTGLFDDLVTPYKRIDFTADPFASGGGLDNGDGDGDVVDDDHIGEDGTVDSIDELEIYGKLSSPLPTLFEMFPC